MVRDEETSWLDEAFADQPAGQVKAERPSGTSDGEGRGEGEAQGQREEFDWIDDAFDDARTAADLERAKGPKIAGVLLVVVLILAVLLVAFAVVGILGALETM